jgi:hypothetical protein
MTTKQKSAPKIDSLTMTPKQVSATIRHLHDRQVSLFLWGAPGIGKSAVIKAMATELGMGFVDIRLSQMDPTDIRGIPYPVEEEIGGVVTKGMRWSAPLVLPHDPKARMIILLDEFNSAPPSVQAAAYQLVLDRKLGEYEVPEGCMIIAAGNRETDKGVTFRMPTPLANRFVHVEMVHNFDDWQEVALRSKYDKDVVGFLTAFKHQLFQFDPMSASRGFATPRSWEFVSKMLDGSPDLGDFILTGLVAGAVGDGVAVQFMEYRKNAADLPDPRGILDGSIKELKRVDVSLCYALTTALCYELREGAEKVKKGGTDKKEKEAWMKQADNFLGFMLDNFSPEICVMGAKTALATFKLQFDARVMKNFERFADRYKSLIMVN